ncbi:protein sidekick-1-like [Scleropages formosus]|uniref:Protein sidekick-1-like n=1 Tax=Scleropages formosus TaxID=113540 RepID=A0A0P7UFK0_SCLFO|nr:protein sidekick-1-like [Scleropages formosus]
MLFLWFFAAPSMAPQNIVVNALSSTQLEVLWEAPPVETQNGNIQGYKNCNHCDISSCFICNTLGTPGGTGNQIHYWEKDSLNETEKVKILFLPETTVRLKNLTSYTYYLVRLLAFNAAGEGPLSNPRGERTLQAAPSIPSFITFSEVTTTTLNVSWGVPLSPNGVVEGYRVVYEPSAPIHGVSKVVTVDIRSNRQRWLKVRDLTKAVTYCFRVAARTISLGPELEANITTGPREGAPRSPSQTSVTKSGLTLTIGWTAGDHGAAPVTGYVIEARPSAQSESPFYEEWWFLIVVALCGLILVLLLVFGLVLHGQSKKSRSCGTGKAISTAEQSVTLDNGRFTALELNSRHLNVKSSFLKKNGTRLVMKKVTSVSSKFNRTPIDCVCRSPPRPSPGGLHYSDEDLCNNYNGTVLSESTSLTEKPTMVSESEEMSVRPVNPYLASHCLPPEQATESEPEDEPPKHSFVNHYMSDPTYFNSWKRQQKGLKQSLSYAYEECASGDSEPYYQTVVTAHSMSGAYTPSGQPAPGSRTPVTGFSSFV